MMEERKNGKMEEWGHGRLRGSYKSHLLRHSGESRPAEAGQNHLNPAFGGTGFRVALRPEHHAVLGFACPE